MAKPILMQDDFFKLDFIFPCDGEEKPPSLIHNAPWLHNLKDVFVQIEHCICLNCRINSFKLYAFENFASQCSVAPQLE